MTLSLLGLLLGGLILLLAGAELLVRGASRLATILGIAPLVIGLTVVAYGTSAPELAVSLRAASAGQADIALGNVVGSNIFNILFVLGLSALLLPLVVDRKVVRLEVPIMIAVALLLVLAAWNGGVGRLEGMIFVVLGIGYTVFQVYAARREKKVDAAASELPMASGGAWRVALYVLLGLGLLVVGARFLVDGATTLARALGVSELVIGLTVIAVGTSLPEIATSLTAALKGERDLAVGNVVGSNIFNVVWVLGAAAALSETGVRVSPAAFSFDLPVMVAASVACLPIFFTGSRISRFEGGLFFAYYLAYTAFLVLVAVASPTVDTLKVALGAFALPLTLITLAVLSYRAWQRGER